MKYTEEKLEQLMQDKGIVRNRRKIESVVTNAKAFLKIREECGSFSNYIWKFVDNKPIINSWGSIGEVPASNELSDKMSKQLKKMVLSLLEVQFVIHLCKQLEWLMIIQLNAFAIQN